MANERNRIDRFAESEDPTAREKILKLLGILTEERQEKVYKYLLGQVSEQVTGVKKSIIGSAPILLI